MSADFGTFEVEVEVYSGNQYYGYHPVYAGAKAVKGAVIRESTVKMFNFENCTRDTAIAKGQKKGKVKSCRKVDAYESLLAIEQMDLTQNPIYQKGNPYPNAIAMGEMVWNKKPQKNLDKSNKRD